MNVFDLSATLRLNKEGYEKGLNDAESKAHRWGGRFKTAMKAGAVAVGAVSTAIVGVGAALKKGINSTADYGDRVDKMSQKIGISAEAYQKWDYVMQRAGTSIDSMKMGMKTLSKQAESDSEAFQKLGISQSEVKSLNQEQLFERTVKGLADMKQGTERAALASELLGRAGADMGALLNGGSKAIDEQMKIAVDYGMVMPDAAVKASAAFKDSVTTMKMTATGLKNKLMGELLPAATKVTDGLGLIFKGDYEKGAEKVGAGIQGITNKVLGAIPKIAQIAGKILPKLADAIIQNLPMLADTATKILLGLIQYIVGALPRLAEAAVKIVTQLAQSLGQAMPKLIPAIVQGVVAMVQALIQNAPMLIQGALALIEGLANGIINALPQLIEAIPKILEALVNGIITNLPKILVAGLKIIVALAGAIIKNLPKLAVALIKIVVLIPVTILKAIPKLIVAGGKLIANLWSGIKDWFGNLLKKLGEKVKGIPKAIGKAVKAMFNAGVNLVKGLWNGIKSFWKNLTKDVDKKSKGIGKTFQRNWKEHSPSRLFFEIGKNLSLGLAIGIEDGFKAVGSAVDGLNDLVDGVDGEVGFGVDTESITDTFGIKKNNSTASQAGEIVTMPVGQESGDRDLTVVLQLDDVQLGKAVYRLNNEETQRVGVSLSGSYA